MDIGYITKAIEEKRISATVHAINRMHERNIMIDDILEAIIIGEVIEEYHDDYPYPSCLIIGICMGRIMHVVCSFSDPVHIITAYEPNDREWNDDFRTRRKV